MNPANPSKIEHLPVSPGADVLPVQFKKAGRKQNVIPAPLPEVSPEAKPRRVRLQSIGFGLYQFPGEPKAYYCRPWCKGKQREKKLNASTQTAAVIEFGKLLGKIEAFENGYGKDPFSEEAETSLVDILDFYAKSGCPGKKNAPRSGLALAQELSRIKIMKGWPGAKRAALFYSHEENRKYHDWRVRQIAPGRGKGGDRAVDKDLVTLSNAFRFAVRNSKRTGIVVNPIGQDRERFRNSEQVTHCREHMCRNAEELNSLARSLFSSVKSEVLGWQLLFQAMIGQRSHEILRMRMDAKTKETPGFYDGKKLYLFRSQSSKGTYGHVDLFGDLKEVLEAHKLWHRKRFPQGSPWFFPSPTDPRQPVEPTSLTHRLAKICKAVGQEHRTSHGLRAYCVNVLRSQGLSDAEIALRIGHKTGGKLIVDVYGEGLDYKIGYRPVDTAPAWLKWLPETKAGKQVVQQQLI